MLPPTMLLYVALTCCNRLAGLNSASQQVTQTLQNKLNNLIKLNNTRKNSVWYFIRLHISDEQLKRRMLMAVPKKGRLYDQCIRLLERADIKVSVRELK